MTCFNSPFRPSVCLCSLSQKSVFCNSRTTSVTFISAHRFHFKLTASFHLNPEVTAENSFDFLFKWKGLSRGFAFVDHTTWSVSAVVSYTNSGNNRLYVWPINYINCQHDEDLCIMHILFQVIYYRLRPESISETQSNPKISRWSKTVTFLFIT